MAIDRAWAAAGFTLHLPGDAVYGFADQRLQVDVPASSPAAPDQTTATVASPEHAAVAARVGFATDVVIELHEP